MQVLAIDLTSGRLLARNTLLNLLGPVASVLAALVAIPILIRELGTEQFGILSLVLMAIGYFGLFDLGLGRALTQLVAQRLGSGGERGLPVLTWTALLLMMGLGVVGGAVVLLLSPWFVEELFRIPAGLHTESLRAFLLLACSLPFVTTTAGLTGILAAHQRFGLINAVGIPMGVLGFLGPVLALQFSNDLPTAVSAMVAVRLLGWLAYLLVCLRAHPFLRQGIVWSGPAVRPLLRFGGWMTVSNVVGPLMVYLDRFLIGSLLSMAAVAYYVTPYEVVTRLWLIPGALLGVLFPAFAASFMGDRERTAALLQRGVQVIFLAIFPVVLVLVALAPEGLRLWLGDEFARNSTEVLRWLAVGVFLNCLAQVPFTALQGIGRPDLTAKLHLLELPLYLLLLWWLVSTAGIEGAAIAWVARVAMDMVLLFGLAHRHMANGAMKWKSGLVSLAGALSAVAVAVQLETLPIKILFLGATLVAVGLVGWFKVLGASEREVSRAWLHPARRVRPTG